MHPALLADGSVRDAGVAGRPSELPPLAQAPRGTLPCGAPIPGLFGSPIHLRGPASVLWRCSRRPFLGVIGRIRFHPPRFLRGVGLDSRLGPRCRSSSGKPVGCGASLGPVRDCSRVSWAPSILRTPFCRRSASPAPSRRPSTEPEFFLRHRPKPFPQGSDRRRTFSPGGDASPKRCVAVADRTMMGHKNEVGPIWRPTLVHNVATAVIHNC